MRYATFFLGFLLLSCAAQPSREQSLMDAIEREVRLPPGADPLDKYGRYYAYSDPGKVVAVYLVPTTRTDPSAGCSTVSDAGLTLCTEEEIAALRANEAEIQLRQLDAGDRRWVKNNSEIPYIVDGGCSQVTLHYDIASKRVLSIGCNGDA